jgi:hypothetical protein
MSFGYLYVMSTVSSIIAVTTHEHLRLCFYCQVYSLINFQPSFCVVICTGPFYVVAQ